MKSLLRVIFLLIIRKIYHINDLHCYLIKLEEWIKLQVNHKIKCQITECRKIYLEPQSMFMRLHIIYRNAWSTKNVRWFIVELPDEIEGADTGMPQLSYCKQVNFMLFLFLTFILMLLLLFCLIVKSGTHMLVPSYVKIV